MKTIRYIKSIIFLIIVLIFCNCHFTSSSYKYFKNESIDAATRGVIKISNDKIIKAISNNDSIKIKSLMSSKLLEKLDSNVGKLISTINSFNIVNYEVLDEYFVKASDSKISIRLPSENLNESDYTFTFESPNEESYVSLLLLDNPDNSYLLTVIYGKYPEGWKINVFRFGIYSILGKNAFDYFKLAKESYSRKNLMDAVENISLSNLLLNPSDPNWQFENYNEVKNFSDSILAEANTKYQLSMTVSNIDTKPQVFKIYPYQIKEGVFPLVLYLTKINLEDTIRLKLENYKIRKNVDSIFLGIDRNKKFILYQAFNFLPTNERAEKYRGFIDTLVSSPLNKKIP